MRSTNCTRPYFSREECHKSKNSTMPMRSNCLFALYYVLAKYHIYFFLLAKYILNTKVLNNINLNFILYFRQILNFNLQIFKIKSYEIIEIHLLYS